ncbi:MAG TPA: ImmA/IrrE family metallo-endopeptidase, partial [Pyrinomonadaceae bacterium]|nr:ImmA/IrrE family metallo-endopeptidase [Pyrinomonadaceae bacterium]
DRGKVMNRDYRKADEEEAYAVGAAALVPYASLKRMLWQGRTSTEIGLHFRVSPELIEYRMKVTRLWHEHKERSRKGAK